MAPASMASHELLDHRAGRSTTFTGGDLVDEVEGRTVTRGR